MRWASLAILLAAVVPAEGLAQGAPPDHLVRTRLMPRTYAASAPDYALQRFWKPDDRAPVAFALLANKTRLVAYPGVQLQVTYTTADGRVVLWFPESGAVRRGRWYIEERRWELIEDGKVAKTSINASICYDYSGGIPNIFAPEWERDPTCLATSLVQRATIDRTEGDVFGLAGQQSPRALGRLNVRTLAELLRSASR
jgi:hypothetical protein